MPRRHTFFVGVPTGGPAGTLGSTVRSSAGLPLPSVTTPFTPPSPNGVRPHAYTRTRDVRARTPDAHTQLASQQHVTGVCFPAFCTFVEARGVAVPGRTYCTRNATARRVPRPNEHDRGGVRSRVALHVR